MFNDHYMPNTILGAGIHQWTKQTKIPLTLIFQLQKKDNKKLTNKCINCRVCPKMINAIAKRKQRKEGTVGVWWEGAYTQEVRLSSEWKKDLEGGSQPGMLVSIRREDSSSRENLQCKGTQALRTLCSRNCKEASVGGERVGKNCWR